MSPLQSFDRRLLLKGFAGGLVTTALARGTSGQTRQSNEATATKGGKPTRFQIACMTLPYSQYPLERALSGIKTAGYKYVAWGTTHREPGESKPVPVMSPDAPPEKARELGRRCRDMGLEPVMMFSIIYPEDPKALEVLTNRVRQAEAAGIEHVLTFGHTDPASQKLWVERLKKLGPIARDHGVLIVAKQHGEIGELTGKIIREVDDEGVKVNYDAGNVMDYTKGKTNPLEDIKTCLELVRSFCMKDHRLYPMDQDCAPGFGEIDHYRLLGNVAFTGRAMPLCCENISIPGVRPTSPEDIDNQGRRTREFLEYVIRALHA